MRTHTRAGPREHTADQEEALAGTSRAGTLTPDAQPPGL